MLFGVADGLLYDSKDGQAGLLGQARDFSFDVEALYVARRRGLKIAEVPVVWRNDEASRVSLGGGGAALPAGPRPQRTPMNDSRPGALSAMARRIR